MSEKAEKRRAGFRFRTSWERGSQDGPGRIQIRLRRGLGTGWVPEALGRFPLPEEVEFRLDGLERTLIRQANFQARTRLVSGTHLLPLAHTPGLQCRVAPSSQAEVRARIGPAVEGSSSSGPIVQQLEISFLPPVVLPNVLQALWDLRHLFDDRTLSSIQAIFRDPVSRGFPAIGPDWSRRLFGNPVAKALLPREGTWTSRLLKEAQDVLRQLQESLVEGELEPGEVHLESVQGLPRWNASGNRWELDLFFSGQVRLMNRATWPFRRVSLPAAILPIPHASLSELLSDSPLASGHLHREQIQVTGILEFLWQLLDQAEVSMEGEGELPTWTVEHTEGDGTRLSGSATLPQTYGLLLKGALSRSRHRLSFRLPTIQCSFPEGLIRLRSEGSASLRFRNPEGTPEIRLDQGQVQLAIRPGSLLPFLELEGQSWHPALKGRTVAKVRLANLEPQGQVLLLHGPEGTEVRFPGGGMSMEGGISIPVRDTPDEESGWLLELDEGRFEVSLKAMVPRRDLIARLRLEGTLRQAFQSRITPIPELDIEDPHLRMVLLSRTDLDARVRISPSRLRNRGGATLSPSGMLLLTVQQGRGELSGRTLVIEPGARIRAEWGGGDTTHRDGFQDLDLRVGWEIPEGLVTLSSHRHPPSRLSLPFLKDASLLVQPGPGGRLEVRLPWSTDLRTPADAMALPDLVQTIQPRLAAVMETAGEILRHFDPSLSDQVLRWRRSLDSLERHLNAEGIRTLGDLIPRPVLCRTIARILTGSDTGADGLEPLIREVTEGRGLDLRRAKAWVREFLPDLDADYELDGILRWLDLVLRPGTPRSPAVAIEEPPIDQDPRWAELTEGVPSAGELYGIAQRTDASAEERGLVLEVAPLLSLAQLEWILEKVRARWPRDAVHRLEWVRAAKRSVARVAMGSGPLETAGRASTVASFLGDILGPLPILDTTPDWPPPCAVGPMDVAELLQIALSDPLFSATSQWNTRLLLELIRLREPEFLIAVLFECSQQAPHILAGVLMGLLNQPQTALREPLDIEALIEEKLQRPVPRRREFLAGGRRVRDSYYGALTDLAREVLERARPWQARRARLREVHHPPLPGPVPKKDRSKALEREARRACEAADRAVRTLALDGSDAPARLSAVRSSVLSACETCAAFLQEVPTGFQIPWMKEVWRRHEEALRVWSVVENVREGVDEVGPWLQKTLGRPVPEREAELVDAVIEALYWFPEDRAAIARDPLVRLLVAPPPGRYELTVVSAMGVITDGKDGRELEDAWRRLEARRGIRLVRADTGLFRSLEYNASAILRALEDVRGPWAWIGYSQGCANGLLAESFLRGGTPDQQRILERLVGRHLLYSAANGSVHGSCGAEKMRLAMEQGERFLKHYQVLYSQGLIDGFFRLVQWVLDSRNFLDVVAGAQSLTLERAVALHRDGQFAVWVPTSVTRGITDLDHLPESLEWLWWMHTLQLPGRPHDSQVPFDEAVGRASRVRNWRTEEFARCEIPSAVQRAHHWSPLTAEVEPITTPRDRERAVYQSPKDRHLVPWIELLARFGRIPRIRG